MLRSYRAGSELAARSRKCGTISDEKRCKLRVALCSIGCGANSKFRHIHRILLLERWSSGSFAEGEGLISRGTRELYRQHCQLFCPIRIQCSLTSSCRSCGAWTKRLAASHKYRVDDMARPELKACGKHQGCSRYVSPGDRLKRPALGGSPEECGGWVWQAGRGVNLFCWMGRDWLIGRVRRD
jgi:hypothetical protein